MASSDRSINHYRVYCQTEGTYATTWAQDAPLTCPNNSAHTISPGLTTVIDSVSTSSVFIESKAYAGTQGFYLMRGNLMNVPEGAPDSVSRKDVGFGMPVCIFGLRIFPSTANIGDTVDMCINPETTVGVLTQPVAQNATVLSVSSTVTAFMKPGFVATLINALDPADKQDMGVVLNVNPTAQTITVSNESSKAWSAGTTLVCLTVYVGLNIPIVMTTPIKVGYGTLGGKTIPADAVCSLVYHNKNGAAKTCEYCVEYTY